MKKTFLALFTGVVLGASAAAFAGAANKTCGQMTADSAVIPEKMAAVLNAAADGMDAHVAFQGASKDAAASAAELEGAKALATQYRAAAGELTKLAEATKAAAAWPGAPHDVAALKKDAKVKEATARSDAAMKDLAQALHKK